MGKMSTCPLERHPHGPPRLPVYAARASERRLHAHCRATETRAGQPTFMHWWKMGRCGRRFCSALLQRPLHHLHVQHLTFNTLVLLAYRHIACCGCRVQRDPIRMTLSASCPRCHTHPWHNSFPWAPYSSSSGSPSLHRYLTSPVTLPSASAPPQTRSA